MASSSSFLFTTLFLSLYVCSVISTAKFDQLFQPYWAADHFSFDGEAVNMKLDNFSGAGFSSKSKYMFGKVNIQIKLVEGDSAGTVTAFYMSSDGPKHHEFDFEFLGNTTGEPYVVQTNVYVNGVGNREQRLNLWFDPTKDFHSYSVLWNQRQVVGGWWDRPVLSELNVHQSHQLIWVRANHMIYDYCNDAARFASVPVECEHHRH
ncbi:Beta-glucanase [Cynara cardunculus var. scolymus]|uniref:Xyloglucan endotransglucosylase/hydrolase n=1 Tax=Cynara cardunculus var. scolymus TaxID=59895 RepID=A0A103XSC0_CYNCS|nr:Beta-glucanase [Cynara cardunculus var. scolymus]